MRPATMVLLAGLMKHLAIKTILISICFHILLLSLCFHTFLSNFHHQAICCTLLKVWIMVKLHL